jgi:hypothetical protein
LPENLHLLHFNLKESIEILLAFQSLSKKLLNRIELRPLAAITTNPRAMPSIAHEKMEFPVFLRRITIYSFPPAFIMLLIHGIGTGVPFPALGLLPLAASALLGAIILYRERILGLGSPIQSLSEPNIFYSDVTIAVFMIAMLIPTWILLDNPWDRGMIVLGTYGSVFMMVNL